MSLRPQCAALMLMLCLALAACSPTAETQLDEQRNPHFLAGREKLGALDYKGAIESFERAVEDNPRSAFAHFELGVLYEREADYAAALYHYNKAVKLRPDGNPAEIIRQRIPACKQELVKADSLAIINPTALRETEQLRTDNAALRQQIEILRAQIAARPVSPAGTPLAQQPVTGGEANSQPRATTGANSPATGASPGTTATPPATTVRSTSPPSTGRGRTHVIQSGETLTSIARRHSIKVNALVAANPGLDPKRMRVGQTLNLPTP